MKKIDKWQEAPPSKPPKALPPPIVKHVGKRRGGKRYRKMRERYKPTQTRMMMNRVKFDPKVGEKEEIVEGETIGLGMLGQVENVIPGQLRKVSNKDRNSSLMKLNRDAIRKQK